MAALINKKLAEEDPAVVILQLLNNSMVYLKHEGGSRLLPRLATDGICHVGAAGVPQGHAGGPLHDDEEDF
jgi:hypothetical protein